MMNSPENPSYHQINPETLADLQTLMQDIILFNSVHSPRSIPEKGTLFFDSGVLTIDYVTHSPAWIGSGQLLDEQGDRDYIVWIKSELARESSWTIGGATVEPSSCIDIQEGMKTRFLISTNDHRIFEVDKGDMDSDTPTMMTELGEYDVRLELHKMRESLNNVRQQYT